MAENRTYVSLDDVLGVRIECKCGVATEGTISAFATKQGLDKCPACDTPWAGGKSQEEQQHGISAVRTFLSQWSTFQQAMKNATHSFSFQIKHNADKK